MAEVISCIGYHGTAKENVESILRHGLRFPERVPCYCQPSCYGPGDSAYGETIWVARTPEQAAHSGPAVFEVNFEGIKGGWYDDEEVWQVHLFEPISSSRLHLLIDAVTPQEAR